MYFVKDANIHLQKSHVTRHRPKCDIIPNRFPPMYDDLMQSHVRLCIEFEPTFKTVLHPYIPPDCDFNAISLEIDRGAEDGDRGRGRRGAGANGPRSAGGPHQGAERVLRSAERRPLRRDAQDAQRTPNPPN